jgi:hypothetical protein
MISSPTFIPDLHPRPSTRYAADCAVMALLIFRASRTSNHPHRSVRWAVLRWRKPMAL